MGGVDDRRACTAWDGIGLDGDDFDALAARAGDYAARCHC
jgi:hypothetical protein